LKHIKILSDYTSVEQPNILHINYDEQGDIHVWTYCNKENEDNAVRLARSGSRHRGLNSVRIWKAFQELIDAYEEELDSEHCHPSLKNLNR
jgi:hypothetical protein